MNPERSVWAAADGVATLFMSAATTARSRMLEHASPLIRLLAQRDAIHHDASLLERELAPSSGPSSVRDPLISGHTTRPQSDLRSWR